MPSAIFSLRLWLSDRLLNLGALIEPDYRWRHRYEGGYIVMWREPA